MNQFTRRSFVQSGIGSLSAISFTNCFASETSNELPFKISLKQSSILPLGKKEELESLQFPAYARSLGIAAVEYSSSFFKHKAKDKIFLRDLNKRCSDNGVYSTLIKCDLVDAIGAPKIFDRILAVNRHKPWVEAAQILGCNTLCINTRSRGNRLEQSKLSSDGIRRLASFAKDYGINIVIENDRGYSADGQWMAQTVTNVKLSNVGTLANFSNSPSYDRYKALKEIAPFAKAVNVKFNRSATPTVSEYTNLLRSLKLAKESAYTGHIGIEWTGHGKSVTEGILASKRLLQKCFKSLQG
ncbi:MAG: TIM barrel protein [Lentisphaeraceae bacterium]|nr:TIM barrel protein [Lentisphaeraceae bacterium]